MKGLDFATLITDIKDDYIKETDTYTKKKTAAPLLIQAACAVLCIGLIGLLYNDIQNSTKNDALLLTVSAKELGMEEYVFGVSLPEIVYSDEEKVIIYDFRGIYVYSYTSQELIGFSDFRPINMTLIQGSNPTRVEVSADGRYVKFYNNDFKYLYDVTLNKTEQIEAYADIDKHFNSYNIEALPFGDTNSLTENQITYIGADGALVSVDLDYDFGDENSDVLRYKNLVILKQTCNEIKEYRLFE